MKNSVKIIGAAFVAFFFLVPISGLAAGTPLARAAFGRGTPVPSAATDRPYFTRTTQTLPGGQSVDEYIINGPPVPPPGYELERAARGLPQPDAALGMTKILSVPAYNWVFGCSSVSGAMIAGYYDRSGFPNMYTGPANGGVAPLDNSVWPTWTDATGVTYPNLPLAASHQGIDGRVGRGSLDDYWVQYNSTAQDPYLANGWTQHAWGDAIGDYMKTSQSAYGNPDGGTAFFTWSNSPSRLTCADMEIGGVSNQDGTYGRKLFYEARGYTVTDCYNQKTDNNGGGFTFALYKAEIDAGRPVLLDLQGHSVAGVGYDDATNTVYLHDTWDYANHTMTWGATYDGMALIAVSVVNLQSSGTPPTAPTSPNPGDGATVSRTNDTTLSWSTNGTVCDVHVWGGPSIDRTTSGGCSGSHLGSQSGGSYQWQVTAHNSYGATTGTIWHFNVKPYAPTGLSASTAGETQINLTWTKSSDDPGSVDVYNVRLSNGTLIATLGAGTTSYPAGNLTCGFPYSFYVTAVRQGVESDPSNTASASTSACTTVPAVPTPRGPGDGVILPSTYDLTFQWNPSSGAAEYLVEWWGGPYTTMQPCGWSSATSCHIGGVWPGNTYSWHVKARNSVGESGWGSTWTFTTWRYAVHLPLLGR